MTGIGLHHVNVGVGMTADPEGNAVEVAEATGLFG